jgi:hypothetical protein
MKISPRIGLHAALLLAATVSVGLSQDYGARLGTVQRGGKVTFEPKGPGVLFDALDPVVRKWYVPQELYAEYGWRQWQYGNYARDNYQRFVNTAIEGNYFYDMYGNFLTRGWLVYDWREEAPLPFGSSLEKTRTFGQWFNRLVIAADHKGQYHYALTLGDAIRTTMTPMTFSKPNYNGLQWDFASDRHQATVLLSRISAPNQEFSSGDFGGPDTRSDITNLAGGRLVAQVGDFVKVGGTFVSAYQSNTQSGAFNGDMFRGELSAPQNFTNVTRIEVRISDDSPVDGGDGGALFASDILIHDLEGNVTRGTEIGFRAQIEGGFQRSGFLSADGNEHIVLRYDFNDRTYSGPDPSRIRRVEIELVIANDYLVEVSSDRQSGVFFPIARAAGNVKDSSNQRVITFDYGLPTATQVAGFTLELTDLAGFEGYLEFVRNRRYHQYPNLGLDEHFTSNESSDAWIGNLSQTAYPWFAFAEGFDIDPGYNTSVTVVDRDGEPRYTSDFWRYEFVDDNDDQDQFVDWQRRGSGNADREVFPGWDENNDFISDFNQNDNEQSPNLLPDYEESFLRFDVDRPEFLYGVDMNHNQWIDRFENDERADYPYRVDQRGYNTYSGLFLTPDIRIHLGRQRIEQISQDRRNHADYALLTAEHEFSAAGRFRLYGDVRKVRDSIEDDLLQWVQQKNTRGSQRLVTDILPAQDTFVHSLWMGHDLRSTRGFYVAQRLKWEVYRQFGSADEIELRGVREEGRFLGLIHKAEYTMQLGSMSLVPRWKSEFLSRVPVARSIPKEKQLTELLMVVARRPVLRRSLLEGGIEYEWFNQMRDPVPPGKDDDFRGLVYLLQLTNLSDYQGYRITTVAGFEVARQMREKQDTVTRTRGFITLYAGIER